MVCSGMQLSTNMGHRFHSLGLLEPFSCVFITNSQEWRLYWRIMPLTILRKMFPFSFRSEKTLRVHHKKEICWFSWIFACLTYFCQGVFCDRSHIQHYTSHIRKNEMKTKTVSFSLVAIKFPFGLQNYWKKKLLNTFNWFKLKCLF